MSKTMIIFVTGNKYKFQIAKQASKSSSFKIIQKKLDIPEIQSESVEEIAAFSTKWASDKLKKPAVVSDGGCYIEALNGFPGPFIKYINKWFSVEDMLRLMDGKKNRRVVWKDCLAYCESGKEPITFTDYTKGMIAEKAGAHKYRKSYSWVDSLLIIQGLGRPLSELPAKKYLEIWGGDKRKNNWQKIFKYLKFTNNKNSTRSHIIKLTGRV